MSGDEHLDPRFVQIDLTCGNGALGRMLFEQPEPLPDPVVLGRYANI